MTTLKTFNRVYQIFESTFISSLNHLSPESCVRSNLKLSHSPPTLTVTNTVYDLLNSKIHIIAFGKAAISMVSGAEKSLGDSLVGGIASIPFGSSIPNESKILFFLGAKHNLPDSDSEETTKRIEKYLKNLDENEIVLFLISGGGSALLPAPVKGITLKEKLEVIKLLASNGATIQELNNVRIALSRVKGGKLAKLVKGKAIALIVSDIIGDPLELIASGPTVEPRKNPKENALSILQRFCKNKEKDVPKNIWKILENEEEQPINEETKIPEISNIQNVIVASNSLFVENLVKEIHTQNLENIQASIVSTTFEGDATEAGKNFHNRVISTLDSSKSNNGGGDKWKMDIFAGETTVHFPNPSPPNAIGGRNQEMALSFFHEIIKHQIESFNKPSKALFGIICLGTDGQDGPTDATGAYCSTDDLYGLSKEELENLMTKVESALTSKTSYNFWSEFHSSKNHVKLGKTGHNLMDVYCILYQI